MPSDWTPTPTPSPKALTTACVILRRLDDELLLGARWKSRGDAIDIIAIALTEHAEECTCPLVR